VIEEKQMNGQGLLMCGNQYCVRPVPMMIEKLRMKITVVWPHFYKPKLVRIFFVSFEVVKLYELSIHSKSILSRIELSIKIKFQCRSLKYLCFVIAAYFALSSSISSELHCKLMLSKVVTSVAVNILPATLKTNKFGKRGKGKLSVTPFFEIQ
jgi:hypothetical protein